MTMMHNFLALFIAFLNSDPQEIASNKTDKKEQTRKRRWSVA